MTPTTDKHAPSTIPTLRDAFAAVPGLETRTVSVEATLAVDTRAAVRIQPRPGERSIGDLPRRAHEAYCAWADGLRDLGILIVGVDATIDVGAPVPVPRPVLAAADVDRLRAEIRAAVSGTQAGPHDVLIYARQHEVDWSIYGLADLPKDRHERVANLLRDHVRRTLAWFNGSSGCALLIPDIAARSARPMRSASAA